MRTKSPSYITLNRVGIYIFQYRFPITVQNFLPQHKVLFRRTLKTRDKRLAEKRARRWWVIMDELTRKYFDTPKMYAKAVELLSEYQAVENLSWSEVEDYLSELDTDESDLLKKAVDLQTERKLLEENNRLRQTVEALKKQPVVASDLIHNALEHPVSSIQNDPNNILLREAIELFLKFKINHVQKSSTKNLTGRIPMFERILKEHTGKDLRLMDLSPELIKYYRLTVPDLPATRSGKLAKASIKDLLKTKGKKISPTTVRQTFVAVGSFLDWLETELYPVHKDLRKILGGWKKPKDSKTKIRYPYDDTQLKQLFESTAYTKGPIKYPSMYWAPLLGLFTGAREGELLQLEFSDIEKSSDGIWFIDINEETDKNVKSIAGIRKVPLHSKLIELGFLDFVEVRKKSSVIELFPEEKRAERTGQFDSFSKRFRTFKENTGIKSTDTSMWDFHSFRHNIRTKLTEARVEENLIDEIVGHTNKSASIGRTVYNHADLISVKKEAIERISYDIDFKKIKPWDKHVFLQLLRDPSLKRAKLT